MKNKGVVGGGGGKGKKRKERIKKKKKKGRKKRKRLPPTLVLPGTSCSPVQRTDGLL